MHKPGHLSADSTPLMAHRSKQETGAIFDELISQMEDVTRIICPRDDLAQEEGVASSQQQQQHQNGTEPIRNGMEPMVVSGSGVEPESGSGGGDRLSVMKRRVQSNDAPKGVIRPSSSASTNRGEEGGEAHPPRAASVETELVFATLPKKKKRGRKWSGIRRIGSPLFRNRRKSFNNATPTSSGGGSSNHTPSPKVHVSVTQPSPSAPVPPTTRRLAMDSRSPISSSSKPRPTTARREVVTLVEKLVKEDKKVGRGVARRRGSSRDECLNALRMMTTLSSNQECLASLISYICLPKSVTK